MLVSFLVAVLLPVSASAGASAPCDVLLAGVTAEVNSDAQSLPPSALAYVNLIKFYIQKSGGVFDASTAQAILNSKSFINPFEGRGTVFSDQMASGLKVLKPKVSDQDWLLIRTAIIDLAKIAKIEYDDRSTSEQATGYMLEPKLIGSDNEKTFDIDPSWYEKDGRIFVAARVRKSPSQLILTVFELLNDELSVISSSSISPYGSPIWQEVGNRLYLIVEDVDALLHLYEVQNGQLEKLSSPINLGERLIQIQNVKGRVFVVSQSDRDYNLHELVDQKLNFISTIPTIKYEYVSTISIQTIKDQIVLLTNYFEPQEFEGQIMHLRPRIEMFVLNGSKLVKNKRFKLDFYAAGYPSWYTSRGRTFMASYSDKRVLYVYELKDEAMKLLSSVDLPFNPNYRPVWEEKHGRLFFSVASDFLLQVFEIKNNGAELLIDITMNEAILKVSRALPSSSDDFLLDVFSREYNRHTVQVLKKQSKDF